MLFLSLLLFWIAYALVGWYLAAHHIIWYVGLGVAIPAIVLAWGSNQFLSNLLRGASQLLLITMAISILIALTLTLPSFSMFVAIPTLTTFLAWLEMRSFNLKTVQVLVIMAALAGFGLGVGEFVDLIVLPSMRY